MEINYKTGVLPTPEQVISLYERAGLPRPTKDKERIQKMFENSGLVVSAWNDEQLVGVCRCVTDWVWCCYLSDLAVDPSFHKSGIGKKLVEITQQTLGEQVMILLLSVPTAMDYYPKIGFAKENRGFSIERKK